MATPTKEKSYTDSMSEAIAQATRIAASTAKSASGVAQVAADTLTGTTMVVGKTVGTATHQLVEQGTETVGKIVTPIAENPLVKYAAKVPGVNVLMAALGQVDVEKAQNEVEQLRREYPSETPEQLAHRIIVDTAVKAGGMGLLTNFLPPLALTLFGVELAALTALQAEMIYRIASVYGFSPNDSARRGEVLAIFGLSVGGSGALKLGLGFVELLPVIGAAVGASNNAALIYSLGSIASRYYDTKRNSAVVGSTAMGNGASV